MEAVFETEELREDVLQAARQEARDLANGGMSVKEIDDRLNSNGHLNGNGKFSEAEKDIVYLLAYHAVTEVRGPC